MQIAIFPVWAAMAAAIGAAELSAEPRVVKHVVVFKEVDRFAGWPANNGIWGWGDELVVGFTLGYHKDKGGGHPIDPDRPSTTRLARSLDGGETWTIETPNFLDGAGRFKKAVANAEAIDFTHPEFAMMNRMQGSNKGFSSFVWSNDRCRTWHGPFHLPDFGRRGIMARTDYLVEGKHEMLMFLTAEKTTGGEGYPFCARTTDGGVSWSLVSWIGEEPGDGGYAIMPSTVRFSDNELLTYIRCRKREGSNRSFWIEPYRSLDNGKTWTLEKENSIDNAGNPAHMIILRDGRLALTFGYRHAPYGVRARISSDKGKTWTSDIVLRDDGGNWDLGYPRTIQRADGKVVTAYYFNNKNEKERHIAATIWNP